MTDKSSKKPKPDEEKPVVVKNMYDLQRLKLEKLMKNPEKPVFIPERPKEKSMASAPDFVRNVMGSSAGAGSGEFHVYRHLRRKEYARQKFIQEKSEKEKLDDDYHRKLEENKRLAEKQTAKKRAKRLKRKKQKNKKPRKETKQSQSSQSESEISDESEDKSHPESEKLDKIDSPKSDQNKIENSR